MANNHIIINIIIYSSDGSDGISNGERSNRQHHDATTMTIGTALAELVSRVGSSSVQRSTRGKKDKGDEGITIDSSDEGDDTSFATTSPDKVRTSIIIFSS